MTHWVHFCDDPSEIFLDPTAGITAGADEPGIFLYQWLGREAFVRQSASWPGQGAVIIEAEVADVVWVQDDPVGEDPAKQEWFLPGSAFASARIVRAEYP